ncbi:13870_t:CDS:1, partial [Racocetra persica]
PSLLSFLGYRLHDNTLEQEEIEHSRYKHKLETILKYHDKTSETGKIARAVKKVP